MHRACRLLPSRASTTVIQSTSAELSTDEMDIRATTAHPAIPLITDNYAAGWQVRPLGEDRPQGALRNRSTAITPCAPIPLAARDAPLKARISPVRMDHRPRWISLAALVVYVACGVICSRETAAGRFSRDARIIHRRDAEIAEKTALKYAYITFLFRNSSARCAARLTSCPILFSHRSLRLCGRS